MAAATATSSLPAPAHSGMPSPRSPTLSDACMILPEFDLPQRSHSPSPYLERPPSPPTLYTHSNRSERTIRLASAPQGRRGPSPQIKVKSPPLSSKSSRSTIRTMADSDGSANSKGSGSKRNSRKNSPLRDDPLASSPTIGGPLSSHPPNEYHAQRRSSNSSGSIHSEDLENLRWPGFDSGGDFDDSGVVLEEEEEEEERDAFPTGADEDEDEDNERWATQADDEYASAALSRRAEMILANAKKRLNVMEGNLRGARESLVVSPTYNSMKMQIELQHQLAAARERDRRLYAGIGPIPPRTRHYHSSPLSSAGSPGHSRGLSETSVPIPFSAPYTSRMMPSKRASSAMGTASGPWSPEGYGQGRFPIRESRSFEVMREPRSNGWTNPEERENSLRSYDSRDSRSPPIGPIGLETLPEDEDGHTLRRSSSTASDLRSQMQDLKGRISSLKQRAKEDNMRRRSLQTLRTPSPFTSAETWYSGTDAYKAGGSPIAADAGVGFTTTSPVRKALFEEEEVYAVTPKVLPSEMHLEPVEDLTEEEEDHLIEQLRQTPIPEYPSQYIDGAYQTQTEATEADHRGIEHQNDADEDEHDFVSVKDDDFDQAGDSVYEDAVYEMPVTERHEDRVDAFDYEHFFLHSAMGTYSSTSRRSSSSSADSAATTRPVTAIDTSDTPTSKAAKRVSYHQRNSSVDSVSTIASFATAAEDLSDEEEENEQMDQFTQQLPVQHVTQHYATQHQAPLISPRSDSAITMRKSATHTANTTTNGHTSPGITSQISASRGSSPSSPSASDLISGLQTSKIYSILLESTSSTSGAPRLALNEEEKQLIYSLAASFQQVCGNLQSTAGDQYERKEWRRRLDEARRVLNGEEFEGEPF